MAQQQQQQHPPPQAAASDPAQVGQALDEDDDFAEFDADNWSQREANFNAAGLWDATWDDAADGQDGVAQQIRAEVAKKAEALRLAQQQGQQQQAAKQ